MLALDQINIYYDKAHILKNISMNVEQGQIVSIIGSNGSGKSTILKAVSGVLKPKTGSITYSGKRLDKLDARHIVANGICRVPEGRHLFPKMTIEENLEMGGFLSKGRREVISNMERCYQYFPILAERRKQLAGTLSGGEQQMLAIARGLMSKPELFLLDEPSIGLAPKIVHKIAEIIYEIFKDGVTILLVEQNARMALNLSHQVYVLESGKIALTGKGKELLHNDHVKNAYLGVKSEGFSY
jgi:branched-chain amino acid transport system ATP-binding protein